MTNNLEYFIEKKYGKKKKQYFASLLWPEIRCETDNRKIAISKKIRGLINGNPKTFSYHLLIRISELLEIKIDELWVPIETN